MWLDASWGSSKCALVVLFHTHGLLQRRCFANRSLCESRSLILLLTAIARQTLYLSCVSQILKSRDKLYLFPAVLFFKFQGLAGDLLSPGLQRAGDMLIRGTKVPNVQLGKNLCKSA